MEEYNVIKRWPIHKRIKEKGILELITEKISDITSSIFLSKGKCYEYNNVQMLKNYLKKDGKM
ncbi:MAG: hypothetical protein QW041_03420 [Candidatus Pacearchaeota archaeon]